eukprot:354016-Prymnesium_polylepis.1
MASRCLAASLLPRAAGLPRCCRGPHRDYRRNSNYSICVIDSDSSSVDQRPACDADRIVRCNGYVW